MATLVEKRKLQEESKRKKKISVQRRKSDYIVIFVFYVLMWKYGSTFDFSSKAEREEFLDFTAMYSKTVLNSSDFLHVYLMNYVSISGYLFLLTSLLWLVMKSVQPRTPTVHFWPQVKAISVNFLLLPIFQTFWDYLTVEGYTKCTTGDLEPHLILRDVLLWMLVFEISWYVQHRAMHDNYYLWHYGHAYHHSWNKPEHMIGITNFAFDHIVEPYVTMSSAFFPVVFFPINFYVGKALAFGYMLLAVMVHWDHFPNRYHLNHHYLVVKNFGSHIPIFDIMFGTYQWDDFYPKDRFVTAKND